MCDIVNNSVVRRPIAVKFGTMMRQRTVEVAQLLTFTSRQNLNCRRDSTPFGAKFEFQFRDHLILSCPLFETEQDISTLKQTLNVAMIAVCPLQV